MSREWNDDSGEGYPLALWENALVKAINGKRGQAFLKELETEMLAMKARGEGRLLSGYLIADGGPDARYSWLDAGKNPLLAPIGCCTLGVMARKKCSPEQIDGAKNYCAEGPDAYDWLREPLNIPRCMIAEIGVVNDEDRTRVIEKRVESTTIEDARPQIIFQRVEETEEQRFDRMLKWVQDHISKNGERVER